MSQMDYIINYTCFAIPSQDNFSFVLAHTHNRRSFLLIQVGDASWHCLHGPGIFTTLFHDSPQQSSHVQVRALPRSRPTRSNRKPYQIRISRKRHLSALAAASAAAARTVHCPETLGVRNVLGLTHYAPGTNQK